MNHSIDPPDPTPVHLEMIAAAGRALGTGLRFDSIIVDYEGSPSIIVRGRTSGSGSLPETVAVKRPRKFSGTAFDEWGSLDFLNRIPDTCGLVPALLAVDVQGELSVMGDLGESAHHQLGWILEGKDSGLAEQGLLAMARTLGRVQGVVSNEEALFRECRGRYPPGSMSRHRVHRIDDALETLGDNLASIGLPLDPASRADLQEVQGELGSPGIFTTWSHGDWTPANVFYDPVHDTEMARFFDLETSGWRNALLDGTYPRLRYIHSVWAHRIPADLQLRAEEIYRSELARGIPGAAGDDAYHRTRLAAASGWMAGLLCFLPDVLSGDSKWGRTTRRQRIVAGLDHFLLLAGESEDFPALGRTFRGARNALRNTWPEPDCTLPYHKALSGSP